MFLNRTFYRYPQLHTLSEFFLITVRGKYLLHLLILISAKCPSAIIFFIKNSITAYYINIY